MGLKSTPRRSRIVFRYSKRLSRRKVTRPAVLGAFGSTLLRTPSSHFVSVSRSSAVGRSLHSSGGISRVWSFVRTSFHIFRFSRIEASLPYFVRLRSPLGLSWGPWHLKQYFARSGVILVLKKSSGAVCGMAGSD